MQINYLPALELAQKALRALHPNRVADRSGAEVIHRGAEAEFRLALLGRRYRVAMPEAKVYDEATGSEASSTTSLILLHYLANADGSPVEGEWIPFRDIPGGNVYERAFRRQSIEPLAHAFGHDPEALLKAAAALQGTSSTLGDVSCVFQALPRLPMICILWRADEEQPAEASILFDASAPHYLPTEDLAALGRALAHGLIRAKGGSHE